MAQTIDNPNPIGRLRRGISSAIKQARYHARNRRTWTFVVSFPKTGRTWLRLMVGRAMYERFGHSEELALDTYRITRSLPYGPVRFSHGGPLYLFDDRPFDELIFDHDLYRGKRVVHLVRDVRDTLVSYYFQVSKREKVFEGDMSAFLRDPRFGARKLIRYYTLWYENQDVPAAFLASSYEALHRDTPVELAAIMRFLGLAEPVEDACRKAVEYASFENMRKLETRQTFDRAMMKPGDPGDRESFKTRKGKVGGFTEYFGAEDLAYVEQVISELGAAGCDWYLRAPTP